MHIKLAIIFQIDDNCRIRKDNVIYLNLEGEEQ